MPQSDIERLLKKLEASVSFVCSVFLSEKKLQETLIFVVIEGKIRVSLEFFSMILCWPVYAGLLSESFCLGGQRVSKNEEQPELLACTRRWKFFGPGCLPREMNRIL